MTAATRPAPAGDAGFSLVESLASLVVVGMMALLLISGVTTGRRAWERLDARQAGGEVVETAQNSLRDRLEKTYPKAGYDGGATFTNFTGTRNSLEFLGLPEDAARPGGVRRYRLDVSSHGDLTLSSSHDLGGAAGAPVDSRILLTNVRGVELAYFGPAAPGGRPDWRDTWSDQPALPELVRIRLTFGRGDHRVWPELLARPLATIDTACRIDTTYHGCKGRA